MNARITYLVICLLMTASLKAQIKIGDNPQNLDPSSVLELESNSRVLVITRMTTIQMENTVPLRGAVVYNTDTQCVHFYDGALWINLCDRPDEQTFSADAIVNFSPTMIITPDANGTNFNFEVGEIRGENIVDTSINGSVDIQEGSITGLQLQDATISFDKLADGINTGELLQWNGAEWILIDETGLTVTEIDGVVGNEILNATLGGSLERFGAGSDLDPYTLDVLDGGIDTDELATNAVTSDKILDGEVNTNDIANDAINNAKMDDDAIGTNEIIDDSVTRDKINANVAGIGLVQAVDGSLEVDVTAITGDGDITSTDGTIAFVGTTTDALFEDVSFDVADNAITNLKMADDAIGTNEIIDDAVTRDQINANVAGIGLNQAVDGSLEVDNINITPDWTNITNIPVGFADDTDDDTTYTAGTGIMLTGTTFSVDNAGTAPDWTNITNIPAGFADDTDDDTTYTAGAGLTLTGTAFSVDNAAIAADWTNLTNVPTGFADDTDDDTTYTAGAGLTLTGTAFSVDNAAIAADWTNLTNVPAGFADNTDDDTTYTAGAGLTLTGTAFSVDNAAIAADWTNLTNVPAGFADDTDDDTTYTAGAGLTLTGTAFSVDNAAIAADWTNLTNVPTGFADDTDDDTTYTAGAGLTLTGTVFSVDNLLGEVTGAPTATIIANNAITNIKMADDAINTAEIINDAVTLTKIADGTVAGQLMQWNGTDWVLAQQILLKGQEAAASGTAGAYTINDPLIAATSIIQLTVEENTPGNPIMIQLTAQAATTFSVQVYEFIAGVPTATNANWHYTVIAP